MTYRSDHYNELHPWMVHLEELLPVFVNNIHNLNITPLTLAREDYLLTPFFMTRTFGHVTI